MCDYVWDYMQWHGKLELEFGRNWNLWILFLNCIFNLCTYN